MKLEDWKNMRTKWTTARNDAGVAKGAVSGVKMGDTIDLIVKATPNGLTAVREAIGELLAKTKTYKKGIQQKSPELVKWIENNLEKPALKLDTACKETIDVLKKTGPVLENSVGKSYGMLRDLAYFAALNKKALKEQQDWYGLAKADIDKFAQAAQICAAAGPFLKIQATKIKVEVPAKQSPQAQYQGMATQLKGMHDCLLALSQTTTYTEYSNAVDKWRRSGYMPTAVDMQGFANHAAEVAKEQGAL